MIAITEKEKDEKVRELKEKLDQLLTVLLEAATVQLAASRKLYEAMNENKQN